MTIKNREKLIQTIKEDCKISKHYLVDGATCAIGALAIAAGYDLAGFLAEDDFNNETFIFGTDLRPMSETIQEEFGLTVDQQTDIQQLNDCHETPQERQEAILEFIATL